MMTTAEALVQYRSELTDGGFDDELADALVRDAAHYLVTNHGLGVRDEVAANV